MDKSDVEGQLCLIEAQLAFLREVSLADDPTHLPPALAELQTMLMELSQTLRATTSDATHRLLVVTRLKKSLAMVSSLREGLTRQSVGIDRALSALVPATQAVTYGSTSSVLRRQPYGVAVRQSGEFNMVAV
jgi:hypothetical protein